jgi:transcriptional regulator with XRE-family HTH domain
MTNKPVTKRRRVASTGLSSEVVSYVLKRGHTQAQVARMVGVSEGYISLVKSQQRSFTLQHLIALAEGIDLPMGEMLLQASDRPATSRKDQEMLDRTAKIVRLADKATEAIRQDRLKKRGRVA